MPPVWSSDSLTASPGRDILLLHIEYKLRDEDAA